MTDKPFCLIDEAAKELNDLGVGGWLQSKKIRENFCRQCAKAVLDRIVPLIVERCAEVADELGAVRKPVDAYWRGYHDACDGVAGLIREMKPKEKST